MQKVTGQCKGCGSDRSPKGNVFTVVDTYLFELENHRGHPVPTSDRVAVCNNCSLPRPFHNRTSAKAAAREALLQSLLAD